MAPPTAGCLIDFLALGLTTQPPRNRSDRTQDRSNSTQDNVRSGGLQAVLDFAANRGPLAIWPYQVSLAAADGAYTLSEPAQYYFTLARKMRTLLLLANSLKSEYVTRPSARDIQEVLGRVSDKSEFELREMVAGIVNRWMQYAQLHPALEFNPLAGAWQHMLLLPDWASGFDWDANNRNGEPTGAGTPRTWY